jgi:hypothetical protein
MLTPTKANAVTTRPVNAPHAAVHVGFEAIVPPDAERASRPIQ